MVNEALAVFHELVEAIGPVGAVFATAAAILYWNIRSDAKEARKEVPLRRDADILLATAVARMADAIQALVNKK